MQGAPDYGCIWILQQLNFPCWCVAQIGCDELGQQTWRLCECQLQTDIDIDPQVETVAEHQPQHSMRHGESINLRQDVDTDIREGDQLWSAVIIMKKWLIL